MNLSYKEWVAAYLSRVGDPLQKCAEATLEMQEAFPELRRVRGVVRMVLDPDGAKRPWPHWWLVAPEGDIVDPTGEQFPGLIVYEEADEEDPIVGRCANCGEYYTRSQSTQGIVCSETCSIEFASSIGL